MLIEFKVENFLSVKDEQILSMIASSGRELEDTHTVKIEKYRMRLLRTAALFGPNASGKTNMLKAMDYMRHLVLTSSDKKPNEETGIIPFKFTKKNQPAKFEMTFLLEGVKYTYGFKLDKEKIHQEWLFYYPKNYKRKLFERFELKTEQKEKYTFGNDFRGENKTISNMTKPNSLFLSVASTLNHPQAIKVYNWFENMSPLFSPNYFSYVLHHLFAEESYEIPENRKTVLKFLRIADFGIVDIKLKQMEPGEIEKNFHLDVFEKEIKEKIIKEIEKRKKVVFIHKYRENGEQIKGELNMEEESNGTQKAFYIFPIFIMALKSNSILLIDELEASLHPLVAKFLLELFHEHESQAQLIFTSHNTDLLDTSLLRRDEIWFTEKDESGKTVLFSLDDIRPKPRLDDDIKKRYLYGKYGAIPQMDYFE